MSGVRLGEGERDLLADALRKEWSGGRDRDAAWEALDENWRTRWREEVDLLPFEAILTARLAAVEALADEWEAFAASICAGCDSCDGARRLTLEYVARQLRAALAAATPPGRSEGGGGGA